MGHRLHGVGRRLKTETESESESSVIPPDDRAAVVRCDVVVDVVDDLSALADSGFVDLAAVAAELGVDFDVPVAGVFLAADDGCCWLAVGATFVVVFAAPAAGFGVVPPVLGFAVSTGFAAAPASVFLLLGSAAAGLAWALGVVGTAACATGFGAGAGAGANGSKVSMRSFDGLQGAAAVATGADGGGVVSGTVLVASGSKSISTPAPPVSTGRAAGAAADCDIIFWP